MSYGPSVKNIVVLALVAVVPRCLLSIQLECRLQAATCTQATVKQSAVHHHATFLLQDSQELGAHTNLRYAPSAACILATALIAVANVCRESWEECPFSPAA